MAACTALKSIALISSSTPSFSAMYFASSMSEPTYCASPLLRSSNSSGAKSGLVASTSLPDSRIFSRRFWEDPHPLMVAISIAAASAAQNSFFIFFILYSSRTKMYFYKIYVIIIHRIPEK